MKFIPPTQCSEYLEFLPWGCNSMEYIRRMWSSTISMLISKKLYFNVARDLNFKIL